MREPNMTQVASGASEVTANTIHYLNARADRLHAEGKVTLGPAFAIVASGFGGKYGGCTGGLLLGFIFGTIGAILAGVINHRRARRLLKQNLK